MSRLTSVLVALALLLTSATPVSANWTMDNLTNDFREGNGLRTLNTPDYLWEIAVDRAREIKGAFFHDFDWAKRLPDDLCFQGWGENIMYRIPEADNPGRHAFFAFWDSPSHRDLILGRWTAMGSAVYLPESGGQWAVQLFVLRC